MVFRFMIVGMWYCFYFGKDWLLVGVSMKMYGVVLWKFRFFMVFVMGCIYGRWSVWGVVNRFVMDYSFYWLLFFFICECRVRLLVVSVMCEIGWCNKKLLSVVVLYLGFIVFGWCREIGKSRCEVCVL